MTTGVETDIIKLANCHFSFKPFIKLPPFSEIPLCNGQQSGISYIHLFRVQRQFPFGNHSGIPSAPVAIDTGAVHDSFLIGAGLLPGVLGFDELCGSAKTLLVVSVTAHQILSMPHDFGIPSAALAGCTGALYCSVVDAREQFRFQGIAALHDFHAPMVSGCPFAFSRRILHGTKAFPLIYELLPAFLALNKPVLLSKL